MKRGLIFLLVAASGCAESPSLPDAPAPATLEEQELDPLSEGRELIDHREVPGNLDRAFRILEHHAARDPESAAIHLLAAEAYSRALEDLGDRKSELRDRVKRLLAAGRAHADQAVRLEPASGAALYWRACLFLHDADVSKSLGKAKEALAQLERAEALLPTIDEGGPSRMKGRVYYELPGLFGGSLAKAIAHYRKSLEWAPDCRTTHLWLGEAYRDAKKPDLAEAELERVLALLPRPGHEKEDGADQDKARELLKALGR